MVNRRGARLADGVRSQSGGRARSLQTERRLWGDLQTTRLYCCHRRLPMTCFFPEAHFSALGSSQTQQWWVRQRPWWGASYGYAPCRSRASRTLASSDPYATTNKHSILTNAPVLWCDRSVLRGGGGRMRVKPPLSLSPLVLTSGPSPAPPQPSPRQFQLQSPPPLPSLVCRRRTGTSPLCAEADVKPPQPFPPVEVMKAERFVKIHVPAPADGPGCPSGECRPHAGTCVSIAISLRRSYEVMSKDGYGRSRVRRRTGLISIESNTAGQ